MLSIIFTLKSTCILCGYSLKWNILMFTDWNFKKKFKVENIAVD